MPVASPSPAEPGFTEIASMGKKKRSTRSARKARSSSRTLIAPKGDKRFVRRGAKGRFNESDDVGRSLSRDRRQAAKAQVKPGQGDRGDR